MKPKIFVLFRFNYNTVSISQWPGDKYSIIESPVMRRWLHEMLKYLYLRGRADKSIFQGGYGYSVGMRA